MCVPSINTFGLTSFQKELWLSHLRLPERHPGISCGGLFALDGVPDAARVQEALGVLVRHFPLLSATLRPSDDIFPVFESGVWQEPDFSFVDLSGEPDPEQAARAWLLDFAEQPFAPLGGRLCCFALLRLTDTRSLFVNRFFHLAGDGIVCITHFNIMARIYGDLLADRPVTLGPTQDWRDDLRQDQEHLLSARFESDTSFLRQQLAALPKDPIFLPRLGCPDRIDTISRLEFDLPDTMNDRLHSCAMAHKAGVADLLLALHLLVLARLYDRDRLTIQVPLRFGERRDQWKFHGHRVNVAPLWVEIGPETTIVLLLADIQRQMRALMRRCKTPFQLALRGEGSEQLELSRIWDTNFNLIPMPADGDLGGVRACLVTPVTSRFDPVVLGVYAVQATGDNRLHLSIDYSDNHFAEQDVRHYIARLELLLSEAIDHPQALLWRGGILLPQEQKALHAWQAEETCSFRQGSIPDLFQGVATSHGDKPAVTAEAGASQTYLELSLRSDGIAAWLSESGVGPGEVVAVMARRHPALAETILGIMKAGAVYLPVDPDYPGERISHMLIDSAAKRVLALEQSDVVALAGKFTAERIPTELPRVRQLVKIGMDSAAYLIYTSGSTGTPKGVLVAHSSFVNMIQAQIRFFGITPADHVLQFASPSFDASLSEIFMALLAGACLYPVSRALIDEPWSLREFMAARRISVVTFPPSYLRLFNRESFPGLRLLITAGEPPLVDDARHYAAEMEYVNAYGPTEASVCATLVRLSPSSLGEPGLIGRPIANTSAYILDQKGRQAAPGIPGELCLAGAGLAKGYLHREELTAERFVMASFSPGLRLYRTGDQAVWNREGEIVLLGRLDEQVKVRGHRVEPGEVSAGLEEHPDILQAVVMALPLTGSSPELIAFLVEEGNAGSQVEGLRQWLRQRLPDYMIPARFHWLAALPIAPTGKVDRRQLAVLARQTGSQGTEEVVTGSPLEEEVRTLVSEVLGGPVPSLTMDFFALGGDSIRLMELGRRLGKRFRQGPSTRQLLADTTVSGIALLLSSLTPCEISSQRVSVVLSLSQGQHQLWVLDRMRGPSAQYNMPFAVEIEAENFDPEALAQALIRAVDAQPSCRVVVSGEIDRPELTLLPASGLRLKRRDLRAEPDTEFACRKLFLESSQQPFSLTEPPLLRALLVQLSDRRWRLLLVMHHIIGDGISLRILLADMFAALRGKDLPSVAPERLQKFSAAEQAYLQSAEAQEDLAWWRKALSPSPSPLDLVHRPRPLQKGGDGALVRLGLTEATVAGLLSLANKAGTTRLVSFLTLVLRFLFKESGSGEVAVGVPVGLRDTPELHTVVGYFVNTVIVLAPPHGSAADLIAEVREVASRFSRAVQHGRYPFPLLAGALGGDRDPSRSPLVDILVTEIDEAAMLAEVIPPAGVRLTPVEISPKAAKLDFSFILHPRFSGRTDLVLEYDTALATEQEATSLMKGFAEFLHQTLTDSLTGKTIVGGGADEALVNRLATAWRQVLGVSEVTAESNFFISGGDSIKAIQVVGQLRRQGIEGIAPAELFSLPTFGQICALARRQAGTKSLGPAPPVCKAGAPVPLLPMQRQLLRDHPHHWRIFHMVLPLALSEAIDDQRLHRALRELPARHEALRLSFSPAGEGVLLESAAEVIWEELTLPQGSDLKTVANQAAARLFGSLDPAAGRLFGAVLARHGSKRLLLIGGHHLVLDAVSLDILRRELAWYCRHGAWPTGKGGCGPLTWASQLAAQQVREGWSRERDLWCTLCAAPVVMLPGAKSTGLDRAGERVVLTSLVTLDRPLSSRPLVELLASLAQALYRQGGRDPLLVDIEGHGREAAFPGLDVSQAVGWFTSTYPLSLQPVAEAAQAAQGLSAWFETVAFGGLGYEILALAEPEPLRYRPQIGFNYLGRLSDGGEDEGFTPLPGLAVPGELTGLLDPDYRSAAPLDLMVYGSAADELVIHAYFSPRCLDQEWLTGLLAVWEQALLGQAALPEEWQELAKACLCRPEEIEAVYEPTQAQEAMLYQQALDGPDSLTYTQQISFRLQGHLNEALLIDAWHLVSSRHAALRSLFPAARTGDAKWLILRQARQLLERHDLSHLPSALQEPLREERLRRLRQHPFALDQGPLFSLQLLKLADDTFEMSWCFHHILMDGWCIGILLRELLSAYAALSRDQTPVLAPIPSWQRYREWCARFDTEAATRYWQGYLAGLKRSTPIAGPQVGNGNTSFTRQEVEWSTEPTTTEVLQNLARRIGVSLPVLVQSLWALLLSVESGEGAEVLFGLVTSGRPAEVEGIEDMVGLFIQTLPVRVSLNAAEQLFDLLRRVQSEALARAPFEFLPLADIQRQAPFQGPLFDHILVFENYPVDGIEQEGAPAIIGVTGFEQHPYDFGLSVVPGQALLFRFSWNPARIGKDRIDVLVKRWQALLDRLTEAGDTPCADLLNSMRLFDPATESSAAIVTPQAVPSAFNDTLQAYPRDQTIDQLFRAVADQRPMEVALIGPSGEIWEYRRLDRLSDAVAAQLAGIEPGEPVALAMERGPEAVAVILGILKAGGCYLPIDTKNPPDRVRRMVQIAHCQLLVHDQQSASLVPAAEGLRSFPAEKLLASKPQPLPLARAKAEDPAYVMFTSGTTGEPKGVVVPHRAVLRLVCNNGFLEIGPGERLLQAGPLAFDASTLELWGALLNGAGLCFIADQALLSPGALRQRILDQRISVIWLTASLCNLLIDEDLTLFAPLRVLLTGGEALSAPHMATLMAAYPGLTVINGYGPTENTTFTTTHRLRPEDLQTGTIPIGRPIANTRVYIIREDSSQASVGERGELCAAGDGLALGYLGNAELTRVAFVELPLPIAERVYRTGDIASWRQDGVLEFHGRRDAQVKVRGYRIELAEIEDALMTLDTVRQAAVVAAGEGESRRLIAYVNLAGELGDVHTALANILPRYMIPDRFETLTELPLTPNGKLDRRALSERALALVPERGGALEADTLETQVAAVFSEVLELPVSSALADFYQLGGQSLKAMRLLARLNRRCQVELTVRDVLTHTTVAALARRIEGLRTPSGAVGMAIPSVGELADYPLSSGQERIWFLQHLEPQSPVYNVPFALRLIGPLDATHLQRALTLLEERHDALRLRVPDGIGSKGLRQRLASPGALRLTEQDCSLAPDPAQQVAEAVALEVGRPFRFGYDQPLLRAMLFKESSEEAVLLVICHHLICDGWSAGIFLKDLTEAWQCSLRGGEPHWQTLPLRYVDYAAWQRIALTGPEGEELRRRWCGRMTPLTEPLALPIDKPRPSLRSFNGVVHRFRLPARTSHELSRFARQSSTTLFTVLAGLVQLLLYRHTGQSEIVIGVPVAGRLRAELEPVLGFFVNTLPLRLRLDPEAGFALLLTELSARWQEALSDQLYPLEALVEALALPREVSRNPLFDVLVALEEGSWTEARGADGLTLSPYPISQRFSKMDMSFYFRERGDGLEVDIEYSTDLFEEETVFRMAERFAVLCDSVLAAPELPVYRLTLMTRTEEDLVLTGFNDTACDWRLDQTIDELFREQVRRNGSAVAIRAADGVVLSYAELDLKVEALAHGLVGSGIGPGDHVGVTFQRSPELMVAIFAVLRVGASYVPFVPGLPKERISAMQEDLGAVVMISEPDSAKTLRQSGARVLTLAELTECASDTPIAGARAEDPAYVLFTSGSTGRPKGVVIEHRGVLNRIHWMQAQFPIGPGDVILQKTPVSFDVSVWELFWWSWTGATLVQLPPGGEKDPAEIVAMVAESRATVIHFVPSMLRAFLHHLELEPQAVSRIASLRFVFASGEALTPELAESFNRLIHAPNRTELHNLYGPTEATVDVTWHPCSPLQERYCVPIGRPIANTRMYVLDTFGHPTPIGVAGELFISGVQVARGYVNRPELTAERFLADPFVPGSRMYRTGDLARWRPDGAIEYLGRTDHQVKVRGFRIELGEIEAALERIEAVAQAVVRVTELAGLPALEAFLLPRPGGELSRPALRRELSEFLPEYMIPSLFYRLDQIPLNASGKADRKILTGTLLGSGALALSAVTEERPSSAIESIRGLWREALPEGVSFGQQDNFFEVGGNSMLLIRLHELLESRWPGVFSLTDLFVSVTVAQQAERLESLDAGGLTESASAPLSAREEPIAVIGMALRLADFDEPEALWSDLLAGVDRTGPMPDKRRAETAAMLAAIGIQVDPGQIRQAAYLDDISGFDCKRFGLAPIDMTLLDPEQRLFLETAFRTLEDGGYGGSALANARVGVFVGASPSQTFKEAVSRAFQDRAEQVFVLNVPSNMASRLGYLKNWNGPAELVDTACSSSLKAVLDACEALRRGECDLALAGGARVLLTPLRSGKPFTIETSTGQTRTFDATADGVGAGEGSVVFLLKPLSRALADGDAIRAVIRGGAVNQDGRSASIAAPNPAAQAEVIRAAARESGVELESLDFFEAHGTGTALGDPVEIDGLTRAFALHEQPEGKAAISSVKGNYGHLDAAAGAIGMAKAILALEHGVVPRQPHFSRANPRIDFHAAPVFVAQENHPLAEHRQPWRCGVSAFGLSGINIHLILEQAPARRYEGDDGSWLLVPLSAASVDGLKWYVDQILQRLAGRSEWPLAAVAATLTCGREHLAFRLAIPARSTKELVEALLAWRLARPATVSGPVSASGRQVAVAGLGDEAAAAKAHDAFMNGDTPFWPEGRPVVRLHLPLVPMERSRCWPEFQAHTITQVKGLLSGSLNAPGGQLFTVPVASEQFWPVNEHWLAGRPTLVGMAMVAMVAEAMASLGPVACLRIEGLSWLRPLVRDEVKSACLGLSPVGDGWLARLSGQGLDDEWQEFAEAHLKAVSRPSARRLDLNALQAEMAAVSPPAAGAGSLVQVSGRWACRQGLWQRPDGTRILAKLRLLDQYLADLEQTPWHPALLDVAASLALDRPGLVPTGCREIRLFEPLPARLFALVSKPAERPAEGGAPLEVDCLLLDKAGKVLAELNGLTFVPLAQPLAMLHPLQWRVLPLLTNPGQVLGPVLLLGEGSLVEQVALLLDGQGCQWRQDAFPTSEEDGEQLAAGLVHEPIATLCCLLPESGFSPWPLAGFLKALLSRGLRQPLQLVAVGRGALVKDDFPDADPPLPDAALVLGLVLSLSQEEPLLSGRYLELAGPVPAIAIVAELGNPEPLPGEPLLLDSEGRRLVRELGTPIAASDELSLPAGTTVLFSGGLGAMALTLAESMAGAVGVSVALLHRGFFPPAKEWPALMESGDELLRWRIKQLQRLEEQGIVYRLYPCDICDREVLSRTLDRVRSELGPISGVVHTAGIAGEGFLISKSRDAFAAVLAPKVDGTRHLHELTLADQLHFFVLASSRTGLSGAPGQSDYAAANAYLDAFARWRRQQGLPALSLDWNTWSGIGMAAKAGAIDKTAFSLPPEQAGPLLCRALASSAVQLVVTMPGEKLPGQGKDDAAAAALTGPDAELPLAERLLRIWAQGLGYDTPLTLDDDFYALGGDSITGMQIINRINRELGLTLSLADLLSHSRLGAFISLVVGGGNGQHDGRGFEPAPAQADYPVSWEQLAVLQAGSSATPHTGYNLPQFLRLPLDADQERLEEALTQLISRHEILRTRFIHLDTPRPRMEILPELPFRLEGERRLRWDQESCRALIKPFDLSQGPLFRARLLESEAGERLLFFDIHHSVADARTIDILLSELSALYQGRELPRPGPQQRDAAWQQQESPVSNDAAARAYWLSRFGGELPLLDLPADQPRPARHSNRGATYAFAAPAEWIPALRAMARAQATTTYTIILSLWGVILSRYARQEELVMAVAADGRDQEELSATTGMFVSLLPLRLRLSEEEPFSDLLYRNHHLHGDAMRFRSFGLNRLLTELKIPVMPERTPLAEVTFSYMNFDSAVDPDTGFRMERLEVENPASKADLAIFVSDTGEQLAFALEYYADLFAAERMERLGRHFLTLLGEVVAKGPELPLRNYSLLEETEEGLATRAGAEVPLADRNLIAALRRQAEAHPHSLALVSDSDSLSWVELLAGAERVAAGLQAIGVGPGDTVGLATTIDTRLPGLMLGVLMNGAICSVGLAEPDQEGVLRALITDRPADKSIPDTTILCPVDELWQGTGSSCSDHSGSIGPREIAFRCGAAPGRGTTLSHEVLLRLGQQFKELGLIAGERVVVAAPADTVTGLTAMWAVLLNGGTLYLNEAPKPEAELVSLLQRVKPQVLIAGHGLSRQLCVWQPASLRPLRLLISLGDTPGDMLQGTALKSCCPNLTVMAGMTWPGTGLLLTLRQLDNSADPYPRAGRPAANLTLRIVDRQGRPSPLGVWGRVLIKGPIAALHHLRPASVETEMIERWRADGELELLRSGDEITPEAVRICGVLLALPLVREAAVFQSEAGRWQAVVAAEDGFDPERVRPLLRRQLPVHLSEVGLGVCPRLPLTREGLVDRPALRLIKPSTKPASGAGERRAEMEAQILSIFKELFQQPAISRDDSFFDLGGHSLLGLQIVNRLARKSQHQLSIKDLFDCPTPAELALRLAGTEHGLDSIPRLMDRADGRFPLSHAQQRLYVLHQMEGGAVAYNMPFAFSLSGEFDLNRFERAVTRLCERHEMLRTGFVEEGGELWQVVFPALTPPIQVDHLARDNRDEALQLFRDDAATPFDLAKAPLFRLRVCTIGQDEVMLSLVMHHIIGDGWSMQILFGELLALYQADGRGDEAGLPPLAVQYRHYAVWQQERDWQQAAAYWRVTLEGAPTRVELPWDQPLPEKRSYRAGVCQRRIADEVMAGLRARAVREEVSLATLILTLFAALLHRLTHQSDMVIGVGVAGREREELEGLIGFFINILPIRVRLDAESELDELLRAVNAAMLAALERQDYPFDLLVRELAPVRGANREALLNVMFEYQRYQDLSGINRAREGGEGLSCTLLDLDGPEQNLTAKYDLTLFVQDAPDGCLLRAEFDSEILQAKSVTAWLEYLEGFMRMAIAKE
jgi:amino acid adenylation domain-containing protein